MTEKNEKTSSQCGRKPKLTPQIQTKIVRLIQMGSYANIAASSVGIGERTFYAWMAKGRAGKNPYKQFEQAIEKAKSECEVFLLSKLMKAIDDGAWQAVAWMLERKFSDRWSKPLQAAANVTNNTLVLNHANIMSLLDKEREVG